MKAKRIAAILTALLVLISFSALPAYAGTLEDYSGEKTAQFAKDNFVRNGNNNWTHDCVKFARLCLEAGGIPRDSSVKSYSSGGYGKYLVSNGYAEKFVLHVDSKGRVTVKGNNGKISPGDLLVNYCKNPDCPKPAFHSSVVYGIEGSYWMQYHHSASGHPGYGYCQTYRCSKCGSKNTICLVYHIKSSENGYGKYKGTVEGVDAKRASYNQIEVSWDKLKSADVGYNVYYKNEDGSEFKLAGTVDEDTTSFKYDVEDPNNYGREFQFYVEPVRSAPGGTGESKTGLKSDIAAARTSPDLPTNVVVQRPSKTTAEITWKKGNGESGCRIEYRYEGEKRWYVAGETSGNSFTLDEILPSKKITIRLRPYLETEDRIKYSDSGKTMKVSRYWSVKHIDMII